MRGTGVDSGRDVLDVLRQEDEGIRRLLHEYFGEASSADHVRRAALGKQLIERCAVQDSVKEEIVHGCLHDLGRTDLADALDERSGRRRQLVGRLDELSAGVTSRDLHVSGGDEFDRTVRQLGELLEQDLRFEEQEVVPMLRREVPPEELRAMSERLDKARGHAPVHPDPGAAPAYAANPVMRKVRSTLSKLRNVADAPAYHPTSKD